VKGVHPRRHFPTLSYRGVSRQDLSPQDERNRPAESRPQGGTSRQVDRCCQDGLRRWHRDGLRSAGKYLVGPIESVHQAFRSKVASYRALLAERRIVPESNVRESSRLVDR